MATITNDDVPNLFENQQFEERKKLPRWIKELLRNPLSISGVLLVLFFIVVAALAPVIAPPPIPSAPYQIPRDGFEAQPHAPDQAHPFGTTQGQYDIFYGVVWGTRTAFKIGLVVTGLTVVIGGLIGAIAAYAGGWLDEIVQRIVEIFLAFPFLLAALTLATVLGSKVQNSLAAGVIALVVFGWPGYSRLIRGDILKAKENDYVLAARALGEPGWTILIRHLIPNAMYSTIVFASLNVGANVLTFAALSFLGVGASIGYADWGQLLSYARNWIPSLATYWYIVVYPGMAIVLFVLSWNLVGDVLRDILDPRLTGSRA